jgi:hypothetical protein
MKPWYMPDARGWIGIGVFALTSQVLFMLWMVPPLRTDDFFKTIATLIVGTGFINGVVSWAYSATKGGGEQAESSARIAEKVAGLPPVTPEPMPVTIVNPSDQPVPVEEPKP